MKRTSVCDFETASSVDLMWVGAWAYAEHPTTEVLCLSFECNDTVTTWAPADPVNRRWLEALIADPNVIFVSHGDFERAIWHHIMVAVYDFPPLPNNRWHDTMAVAGMKQLPLNLEKLAAVIGSPQGKDMEGRKLVLSMSKPNKKTGMLDRSPATLQRAYQYCENDVREERGVLNRIGFLQPGERAVWLLDQTINQRGIRIDLDYVAACQKVVDGATEPLAAEFIGLTGVRFTQREKIMDWLTAQGYPLPNLKKETIAGVLGHDIDSTEDDDEEDRSGSLAEDGVLEDGSVFIRPPRGVERALTIRQLVGSAAIKKLPRMAACVNADGRARGLLQYHRAGPGRWAGRILQPHNFPRPSLKDGDDRLLTPDVIVGALMTGDWRYVEAICGGAVETVVSGLRHAMVPDKGKVFISADYMQIEARIVLALAGQHDKCQVFVTGKPYADMAQSIYHKPVDKHNDPVEYTIGKNTVLGCGFGMGKKTFRLRYCPLQTEEFAERVVNTYRKDWAPLVPDLWEGLNQAAVDTVWSKQPHEAYGVRYALEDGWLTARLPSGRKLYYWNPQAVRRAMPWSTAERPDIRASFTYLALKNGRMKTVDAFGGLLTENVVQGLARDILVHAMFILERENFPLVLTVHDEALPETARLDEKAVAEIMTDVAPWVKAMKIPIGVETWMGDRYRK